MKISVFTVPVLNSVFLLKFKNKMYHRKKEKRREETNAEKRRRCVFLQVHQLRSGKMHLLRKVQQHVSVKKHRVKKSKDRTIKLATIKFCFHPSEHKERREKVVKVKETERCRSCPLSFHYLMILFLFLLWKIDASVLNSHRNIEADTEENTIHLKLVKASCQACSKYLFVQNCKK